MEKYKLGEMERKFADIIWETAPVSTGELVKICEKQFDWKRTTTYTMLKRLCQRELFANESGTVVVIVTKEEFKAAQGELFIRDNFDGSLPLFLTAFSRRKKLSDKEIDELRALIDSCGEDGKDA